jgi:hypothetical protein
MEFKAINPSKVDWYAINGEAFRMLTMLPDDAMLARLFRKLACTVCGRNDTYQLNDFEQELYDKLEKTLNERLVTLDNRVANLPQYSKKKTEGTGSAGRKTTPSRVPDSPLSRAFDKLPRNDED